jgi:predicted AAA+ superfamily ATPase
MFIDRHLKSEIDAALKYFPVVLITGPRQSGKTELLKHSYKKYLYYSIDALDVKQRVLEDPRSFFEKDQNIIFDEIQEVPELLHYIKEVVDNNRRPGRIILTGSQQFSLMQGVSESLAGRIAIFNLLPLSYAEIKKYKKRSLGDLLVRGSYPQIQTQKNLNHELWFASYIKTYVERDLRQQIQIKDMRAFEQFLQLLASRVSQELNLNRLAAEVGVHSQTVKSWISALEAAFIVFLLNPYYENFGKRIIKSPKLYFYDSGLLAYLLKERDSEKILLGAMSGAIFENFVLSELMKNYLHHGRQSPLYFWRSQSGVEVDVLIDEGRSLGAVEIKLTKTLYKQHTQNLEKFAALAKKNISTLSIISRCEQKIPLKNVDSIHWSQIEERF